MAIPIVDAVTPEGAAIVKAWKPRCGCNKKRAACAITSGYCKMDHCPYA